MNKKISLLSLCAATLLFFSCKKNASPATTNNTTSAGTVLTSETNVVIAPTYVTLANDAAAMYTGALLLQTPPVTQQNLLNFRQLWLKATADYEQSSATLFGPNGGIGADPASLINTYPIDTFGINSLIVNNYTNFDSASYIDSLPSYLTGFHGIEFVLYGIHGNKTAAQFTTPQLAYITAVALEIQTLTSQVASGWSAANQGSYYYQFTQAGSGSAVYPDQRAAFSDLTMGIANICETDAIYKLDGILANKSAILQESPFANNSIANITNNLIGVRNIYYGQYNGTTGTGLTAFVSQNAINLDIKIKNDITAAINAVGKITPPLSQAVYSQTALINAAANACDSLNDDLKVNLLTYLNGTTN